MSADGYALLTTLGEAGGIAGIVAVVFGLLIRMMKKNGCTCKFYNCNGGPLLDVDCEEGAPGERYLPKTESSTPAPPVKVETVVEKHRVVRPSDVAGV
jgi:hypothetical protein